MTSRQYIEGFSIEQSAEPFKDKDTQPIEYLALDLKGQFTIKDVNNEFYIKQEDKLF